MFRVPNNSLAKAVWKHIIVTWNFLNLSIAKWNRELVKPDGIAFHV